jgi:hypothetical protein
VIKLLYKPLGLLINSLYGVLAGAVINRVWTSAARADDAPKATDAQRRWYEVALAAAFQGRDLRCGQGRCRPRCRHGHAQGHRDLARRRRAAVRPGGVTMAGTGNERGAGTTQNSPEGQAIPPQTEVPGP